LVVDEVDLKESPSMNLETMRKKIFADLASAREDASALKRARHSDRSEPV